MISVSGTTTTANMTVLRSDDPELRVGERAGEVGQARPLGRRRAGELGQAVVLERVEHDLDQRPEQDQGDPDQRGGEQQVGGELVPPDEGGGAGLRGLVCRARPGRALAGRPRAGRAERRRWTVSATGQLLPGTGLLGAARGGGRGAGRDRARPGRPRAGGVCARPARGCWAPLPGQDSLPVFSTFCSSVLALLTVEEKLAPCISAFIMLGMIWSVASAVAQFLEFSGEIWV